MSDIQALREAIAANRISMTPNGEQQIVEAQGFFMTWRTVGTLQDILSALTAAEARAEAAEARVGELEAEKERMILALTIYEKCANDCVMNAMFSDKQTVVNAIERAKRNATANLKGTPDGR